MKTLITILVLVLSQAALAQVRIGGGGDFLIAKVVTESEQFVRAVMLSPNVHFECLNLSDVQSSPELMMTTEQEIDATTEAIEQMHKTLSNKTICFSINDSYPGELTFRVVKVLNTLYVDRSYYQEQNELGRLLLLYQAATTEE